MIYDERTIVKDLTVMTINVCQDKNREPVPQRRRMLKICLFGKDSHINDVTETLISCFWRFFERFSKWKSFVVKLFFFIEIKTLLLCTHTQRGGAIPF